jgi:hydroxysqualene dehydroxylase
MRIAVVGGGWAGLAAAVTAAAAGHQVSVFEAARRLGGRARALPLVLASGETAMFDNGQHILIGAYRDTLRLMRAVGADPARLLRRLPLALRFPDGGGLTLPDWPSPLDALAGIAGASGWSVGDKLSLLAAMLRWRRASFQCEPEDSVLQLCSGIAPRVVAELIEPLCVSALNTPAGRASGQVFLAVLRDSLFTKGGSNLLLPTADLGSLFPERAGEWLLAHGARVQLAHRVDRLAAAAEGWVVDGDRFDGMLLAGTRHDTAKLIEDSGIAAPEWLRLAGALEDEAVATVYVSGGPALPLPMMALRSGPGAPAQFVFDRGQLGGPAGVLAFVVSACGDDRDTVQNAVLAQARALGWRDLVPLQTVVEKRATFACTPGLRRPPLRIARGLAACGDYVEGPYPATLEGAVRSGIAGVTALSGAPRPLT